MTKIFPRISYLVSRAVTKPDRAFSAIASYNPIVDVMLVVGFGAAWTLICSAFVMIRDMFRMSPVALLELLAHSLIGYLDAILILAMFGFLVSVTATIFGGKARLLPTILAFVLTGAVALGVTALPIMVIKFVDFGERMTPISKSIISVGPWIYIVILLYLATVKIHKTVAPRAVAYLGLASLPLILILVFIYRYGPIAVPVGHG